MSQISNRFYITALEDGTTLHGNLTSDRSLSQAWNSASSTAIPNWTITTEQPTIFLTLMSGATLVQPSQNFNWYYNNSETPIAFNESTSISTDGLFQKTTHSVTYGGQTVTMPALKIIGNLASSSNVDIDTILFKGSYTISGSSIDFSASIQVRISAITTGSNMGVVNFVNGVSNITEPNQAITMYGRLYSADGQPASGYTTKWYLNDSSTPVSGTSITVDNVAYTNAFQVTQQQVVDHAIIRCEFYDSSNNLLYTTYAAIDDMQDPEFLYIQYNGSNGNAASLRKNETATFQFWVGTRDDAGVLGGAATPTYPIIKVKLLDGDGAVITDSGLATQIPNPDANGWRDLSSTMSQGKATLTPHYDTVNGVGKKNLTGIVIAYTS